VATVTLTSQPGSIERHGNGARIRAVMRPRKCARTARSTSTPCIRSADSEGQRIEQRAEGREPAIPRWVLLGNYRGEKRRKNDSRLILEFLHETRFEINNELRLALSTNICTCGIKHECDYIYFLFQYVFNIFHFLIYVYRILSFVSRT